MTDDDLYATIAKGLMIGIGAPLFYLYVTAPLGRMIQRGLSRLAARMRHHPASARLLSFALTPLPVLSLSRKKPSQPPAIESKQAGVGGKNVGK